MEALGLPYTGSGPSACLRCTDKVLAKHLMREAGIPTPPFHALRETSIRDLGAAAAVESIERELGFPLVVKPARGGSALGVKFASDAGGLPGAMVGRVLLRRHDPAGAPHPGQGSGRVGARAREHGARALPIVEAVPREEDFYDYESRYEIGKTTFVCPAELPEEITEPRPRAGGPGLRAARLPRLRPRRPDARGGHGALWVLETNVVPGLTETSLLPQAADAAGIAFDELVERILASAFTR